MIRAGGDGGGGQDSDSIGILSGHSYSVTALLGDPRGFTYRRHGPTVDSVLSNKNPCWRSVGSASRQ